MGIVLTIKGFMAIILGGLGSPGNDFPINAAYPLFDNKFEQREYDAAKAAELAAELAAAERSVAASAEAAP